MKPARALFVALAFVTCAGVAMVEGIVLPAHHSEQRAQRDRNATLARELADARRRQEAAARDFEQAERQLAQLPPVTLSISAGTNAHRDPAVAAWLGRVKRLRDLVAQEPGRTIPEMQLLANDDWLRVARDAAFETEQQRRQAAAALRTAAKMKFTRQLSTAAKAYTAANPDAVPTDALELAAHGEPPLDAALLRRYAIVPAGAEAGPGVRWSLLEIAPVDEDYDNRFRVDANGGGGSSSGLSAWINDFRPRMEKATAAYAAENGGARPRSLGDVLPYMRPPLPPATVEKLLRTERGGQP